MPTVKQADSVCDFVPVGWAYAPNWFRHSAGSVSEVAIPRYDNDDGGTTMWLCDQHCIEISATKNPLTSSVGWNGKTFFWVGIGAK